MSTKVFVVLSLICLCCYLYGILISLIDVEPNVCKMTYMYEYPQFVKISFTANREYPKYNLYAYSEGRLTERARNMYFDGAPVIFVPGNSGSYKQARSFASVALRKGLENRNNAHLDYFTVDFNEEYSALYGGYLTDQTNYLADCIRAVLDLYRRLPSPPKSVVLIGHSMGGKLAQMLLSRIDTIDLINTIITLSSPMDRPVLNIDYYFEQFYRAIDEYWLANRSIIRLITANLTNCCERNITDPDKEIEANIYSKILDDKLLITIGGGSRDLLVHPDLTYSIYSDVHTMSTAMPNVWLTTDHLCAVWCLQQVLVVNRFLYSIIDRSYTRPNDGINFIDDKQQRLAKAKHYFTQSNQNTKNFKVMDIVSNDGRHIGEWIEDSRRVFMVKLEQGFQTIRVQMIRFIDLPQHKFLDVETIGVENDEWFFGCAANENTGNMRYCPQATSLSHLIKKLPSQKYERKVVSVDMHKLKADHPSWTHVLILTTPTRQSFQLNIDAHGERDLEVILPRFYLFSNELLKEETGLGSVSYTINLSGIEDPHQTVELIVKPLSCTSLDYHVVAELCVPWAKGFNRFHYFTNQNKTPMFIYVPTSKPSGYNTTVNPIRVQLTFDPQCRYQIIVKNSFGMMMARIVQLYSQWLPGHMVAILLLAFKYQVTRTPINESFKCGKLQSALLKCSPFFILTASRLFVKVILWTNSFPEPDPYENSLIVSILIHGASLAMLSLITAGLWLLFVVFGTVAYKVIFKTVQYPIKPIPDFIIMIIQKLPITVGVLLISITVASCGAIALICAVGVYFILISKMYEDYLEEFVYKTAKLISNRLFGTSFEIEMEPLLSETDVSESTIEPSTKEKQDDTDIDTLIKLIEKKNAEKLVTAESTIEEDYSEKEVVSGNIPGIDEPTDSTLLSSDKTETDEDFDAQIDKLLKEALEKQMETAQKKSAEEKLARIEYDSVHEGLSAINFHLPIFLMLVILAVLNLPSAISWAKNYSYTQLLEADPSRYPAIASIAALSLIWQMTTPRKIRYYNILSYTFYVLAAVCILYTEESIYRLNSIIASTFILIAGHQLLSPKLHINDSSTAANDLGEDVELMERVKRIRESLANGDDNIDIDGLMGS